jgi:hypothetical protein
MIALLVANMEAADAPPEQYERLGVPTPARLRAATGALATAGAVAR